MKIDGRFKDVTMAAVLVKLLRRANDTENRKKAGLDRGFLKALIIGLCTAKSIEKGEQIHKDILIFIKELFLIRIEGEDADGSRYKLFQSLVSKACDEIRVKNYK